MVGHVSKCIVLAAVLFFGSTLAAHSLRSMAPVTVANRHSDLSPRAIKLLVQEILERRESPIDPIQDYLLSTKHLLALTGSSARTETDPLAHTPSDNAPPPAYQGE